MAVNEEIKIVPEAVKIEPFVVELAKKARKNNKIKQHLYKHYNVKRGLRNADGTGVLFGLTGISDVHGYVLNEGERAPVAGSLSYRGLNIEEIVKGCQKDRRQGFEETAYLLLFGELPTRVELDKFCKLIGEKHALPEGFTRDMILKAPSGDIMNKLARSVLVAYSYDKNPEDRSLRNILRQCILLIARFPTMVAYGYQAKAHYHDRKNLFIHNPDPSLGTAENLLHMIRSDGKYTKTEAELLDLSLILHAEHGGGNNSTFTTHVVTSADTDVYSAVAAAVGSLKGLRHGGASIKAVEMMQNIKKHVTNYESESEVADYLVKIINRQAYDKTGLVYGMGHAVYTLSDPRAVLLKKRAAKLAREKDCLWEFELYSLIERICPEIFKKVKGSNKPLCANVDFYSGFVYRMLDIPVDLYTPIFAVARIAGWCAHILEERVSGGRINRPACKNIAIKKEYIPLSRRKK